MTMWRTAIAALTALVLVGAAAPAGAGGARTGDREQRELPGLAISDARFAYGDRVSAVVRFSALSRSGADKFILELRGAGDRVWQAAWEPESGERSFVTFLFPGGMGSDDVRCTVRWQRSLTQRTVTASLPSTCLRLGRRAAPARLKMGFFADDTDARYRWDAAPGSNSLSGGVPGYTRWIPRG